MRVVSITESARVARINRSFDRIGNDLRLRRARFDTRNFADLGRFYIVDWKMNAVVQKDVDVNDLALALWAHEKVAAVVPKESA